MLVFEFLLKGEFFFFFFFFLIFCHLLVAVGALGAVHGTVRYTAWQHNSVSLSLLISIIIYSSSYVINSAEVPMVHVMLGEDVKALKQFHWFGVGLMTKQTFKFWIVFHSSDMS